MTELLIAAGFIAAALVFFLLVRAARPAPTGEQDARTMFESLPAFSPSEVHAHQGSAIGYDPVSNIIAVWDKAGGPRLVDPSGVSAWRVTPAIDLFAKTGDRKPFFTVAILSATERAAWRDRLQAAFGGETELKS